MFRAKAPALTPIQASCGPFLPLDIDVSPFDNSKKHKEKVSRAPTKAATAMPRFSVTWGPRAIWSVPGENSLYQVLSLDLPRCLQADNVPLFPMKSRSKRVITFFLFSLG